MLYIDGMEKSMDASCLVICYINAVTLELYLFWCSFFLGQPSLVLATDIPLEKQNRKGI